MWRKAEMNHVDVQEQSERGARHSGARGDGKRWVNTARQRSRCYYNPHPAITSAGAPF